MFFSSHAQGSEQPAVTSTFQQSRSIPPAPGQLPSKAGKLLPQTPTGMRLLSWAALPRPPPGTPPGQPRAAAGPSPPWPARRAGSGRQGRCRARRPPAGARAADSSSPRPWQRVLRASARVPPHEVLRAGGAGWGAVAGSLSVLFSPHHVLGWERNTGLRLLEGKNHRIVEKKAQPISNLAKESVNRRQAANASCLFTKQERSFLGSSPQISPHLEFT